MTTSTLDYPCWKRVRQQERRSAARSARSKSEVRISSSNLSTQSSSSQSMSLSLYLLRHGQTELSREDSFCGSGLDPELTPDGREMAQAFSDAYQAKSWIAIYSSSLRRALATAQPLCDALGMKPAVR